MGNTVLGKRTARPVGRILSVICDAVAQAAIGFRLRQGVRFIPDKPVAARCRMSPSDDAAGRRRGGEISAAKTPSRCAVFGAGQRDGEGMIGRRE
jgi:hypothetical protein